jgi:hypothetical protein
VQARKWSLVFIDVLDYRQAQRQIAVLIVGANADPAGDFPGLIDDPTQDRPPTDFNQALGASHPAALTPCQDGTDQLIAGEITSRHKRPPGGSAVG